MDSLHGFKIVYNMSEGISSLGKEASMTQDREMGVVSYKGRKGSHGGIR